VTDTAYRAGRWWDGRLLAVWTGVNALGYVVIVLGLAAKIVFGAVETAVARRERAAAEGRRPRARRHRATGRRRSRLLVPSPTDDHHAHCADFYTGIHPHNYDVTRVFACQSALAA
jgi:hypothetical protein